MMGVPQKLRSRLVRVALVGIAIAVLPSTARADSFAFTRKDYVVESYSEGLDSVAVGDLDGKNGPDIVVESLTGGPGMGRISVLIDNGNGSFADAVGYDSCAGAHSIVLGQFNPGVDDHLDIAVICGSTLIGRKLGDGQGHFGGTRTIDVGATGTDALTGNAYITAIDLLRVGAMNGPTIVFAGALEGTDELTLCFLETSLLQNGFDGGAKRGPRCDFTTDEEGEVTEWGTVSKDLAVGAYFANPDDPLDRDEALSFGSKFLQKLPLAISAWVPFDENVWAYDTRSAGNVRAAIALADVDGDLQNDVLMGGNGTIAKYVPGEPIAPAAVPKTFASVASLYDLVTGDFDGDGNIDVAALGDDDDGDEEVTVAVHRGDGEGGFTAYEGFAAKGFALAQGRQVIAVADFDRNTSPDLVTVGTAENTASVLFNAIKFPERTCGDPQPSLGAPTAITASDALSVLTSATGAKACFLCVCDVNDSGTITATDALSVLRVAVGAGADLTCPPC